jgi:2-oxoglutarate ferredoxin oxidoreductase subunit beta
LTFGAKDAPLKGLKLNKKLVLEVVDNVDPDNPGDDILVHDETNPVLANLLARMRPPYPVAMGVLYRVQRPTYDGGVAAQIETAKKVPSAGDLAGAIYSGSTWVVE